MATKSLSQYLSEVNKSYDNSRKSLQNQIDNVASDLAAQKDRINAQYAQQGKNLDNQRNYQAQASSMSASNNGGSFGGSAEIANKKYYQQSYVPAVTQMQTNQSNDLSSAESQANSTRLSLQQSLASLNDEATRLANQYYNDAVEAEKTRQASIKAAQIQANATANAYKYLNQNTNTGWGKATQDENGTYFTNNSGNGVTMGTYLRNNGISASNSNILNYAKNYLNSSELAQLNRIVSAQQGTKRSNLSYTTKNAYQNDKRLSQQDNDLLRRLGITF